MRVRFKRRKKNEPWVNVPITDDYMFYTVMENEENCKEFLRRVLGIEVIEIQYVNKQHTIRNRIRSRGIRLDIYVRDKDGNTYNIEMQSYRDYSIAKRTRYYHSEMDGYLVRKGQEVDQLGKNIVIFVCTYDPFGDNRSKYTFKNICVENTNIALEDDTVSIFLNTNGDRTGISNDLENVLEYIRTGETKDDYTKKLDRSVQELNNDYDWRDRQMTLEMKLKSKYNIGHKEGYSLGREEGIEFGKFTLLYKQVSDGTISVVQAASYMNITKEEFEKSMIDAGYEPAKK